MRPARIVKWRLTSNFVRAASFSASSHDKKSTQNKYGKISGRCKIKARAAYDKYRWAWSSHLYFYIEIVILIDKAVWRF